MSSGSFGRIGFGYIFLFHRFFLLLLRFSMICLNTSLHVCSSSKSKKTAHFFYRLLLLVLVSSSRLSYRNIFFIYEISFWIRFMWAGNSSFLVHLFRNFKISQNVRTAGSFLNLVICLYSFFFLN